MNNFVIYKTPEFIGWLEGINNKTTYLRLLRRIEKAQRGILGDTKPVGDGVFEMRENFGPGWRIYFTMRGGKIIVLLGGGDKGSQQADIALAKELAKHIEDSEP